MEFITNNLIAVGIGIAAGVVFSIIVHLGNTANLRRRIGTLRRQNGLLVAEVKEVKKENGWLREANEQIVAHPELFKKKYLTDEIYESCKEAQFEKLGITN